LKLNNQFRPRALFKKNMEGSSQFFTVSLNTTKTKKEKKVPHGDP